MARAPTGGCGSTQVDPPEADRLDPLVLDHHQAPEQLPDALAIVNPNRQDDLWNGRDFLLKTQGDPLALLPAARRALASLDPVLPLPKGHPYGS